MLVVAIISILASIAIPQFLRLQLHSRRSEVILNLDGIILAELAYVHLEHDVGMMVECSESPLTPLGRTTHPFDSSQPGWLSLGWEPDGKVYCHYAVEIYTSMPDFSRAIGTCDMDGDGDIAVWWGDVDPGRHYSSAEHNVVRPSATTTWMTF